MKASQSYLAAIATLSMLLAGCGSSSKKTDMSTEKKSEMATTSATDMKTKTETMTKEETAKASKKLGKKVDQPMKPILEKVRKERIESATASEGEKIITCMSGEDKRVIKVSVTGNSCELTYEKQGSTSTPASAKNEPAYCDGVATRIQEKLTGVGYECK